MNGITDSVARVDALFLYILGISLFLLVLITALMIYFAIRYRRSRNPEPADIRGNWLLETVWTLIPTVLVLSMFYFGWQSYLGLRQVPDDAIEIGVIGQQFSWIFVYPNEKVVESELVVPQGRPIKLNITAEDVNHSLFIPAFRIKMDAVPGMETYTWFFAEEIGQYDVFCAEYCGVGHSQMRATLRIVPESEYRAWLLEDQ
jgi:cytochrome c oxidase subunit II